MSVSPGREQKQRGPSVGKKRREPASHFFSTNDDDVSTQTETKRDPKFKDCFFRPNHPCTQTWKAREGHVACQRRCPQSPSDESARFAYWLGLFSEPQPPVWTSAIGQNAAKKLIYTLRTLMADPGITPEWIARDLAFLWSPRSQGFTQQTLHVALERLCNLLKHLDKWAPSMPECFETFPHPAQARFRDRKQILSFAEAIRECHQREAQSIAQFTQTRRTQAQRMDDTATQHAVVVSAFTATKPHDNADDDVPF